MTADAIESTSSARPPRQPWNRGKLIGQKPPLKPREVWAIRIRLQIAERLHDLALSNLAIDRAGRTPTGRAGRREEREERGAR